MSLTFFKDLTFLSTVSFWPVTTSPTGGGAISPGDLTDTNFVTGIHVGDADSMITYHVSSPFAVPGTSFITTPLDSFSITGTVAPVPETSSMGLLSLLTCASGWFIARTVGRRIKGAPDNVEIETT
jgi:hypothetical protein